MNTFIITMKTLLPSQILLSHLAFPEISDPFSPCITSPYCLPKLVQILKDGLIILLPQNTLFFDPYVFYSNMNSDYSLDLQYCSGIFLST